VSLYEWDNRSHFEIDSPAGVIIITI
jgi:hypothetical protein